MWALQNNKNQDKAENILHQIIGKHWSHLDMLLQWNLRCAEAGGFGQDKIVTFGADGQIDFTCVSQLDACVNAFSKDQSELWGKCYTNLLNGGCPVRNCGSYEGLGTDNIVDRNSGHPWDNRK